MATPISPYLFFDGNCAEAMRFYHQILGGKLEAMMTYGESPDQGNIPPDARNKIMHAYLVLDNGAIMASDHMIGEYEWIHSVAIAINFKTADEARRVFDAFSDGGQIVMPMTKTFWTEAFGMTMDRYGAHWMIGVEP